MGLWAYTLLQASSAGGPDKGRETTEALLAAPAQNSRLLDEAAAAEIPAENAFQGVWEAAFNGGQNAVIAFSKGRYQILITENPALPQRLYAQGAYRYEPQTGILDLRPDVAAPPPAPSGLIYEPLTRRAYKIQAALNETTGHLFLKPRIAGGAHDQVHPLFFHVGAGKQPTGWSRRKTAAAKPAAETKAP